MNKERVYALIWKDIIEIFHNETYMRNVLLLSGIFGLFTPFLIFLGLNGILPFTSTTISGAQKIPLELIPQIYQDNLALLTTYFVLQYINPFLFLFLSCQLATTASVDITVGEKERNTIERLLSLAITDSELIFGKLITPFLLSLVSSGLMIILYFIFTTTFIGICPAQHWIPLIFLLIPSSILFSVSVTLIITIRNIQYREALQYTGIVSLLPSITLLLLQLSGYIIINTNIIII
ncbi:ABC transporter permease subunit, partial [Candidatus Bathyarchaeota archaeon]|nr:ABC transporter permease subunit [Candidatus Bathyarchaeota archaeon]